MARGVGDIVSLLTQLLPPWAMVTVAVLVLLLAAPQWFHSMRIKQIGGAIRRMVRADDARRQELSDRAMTLAGHHAKRLLAVAEQAVRYNQHALRNRALDRLDETGALPDDVHRLRHLTSRETGHIGHPLEVVVGIEGLLDQGMNDTARRRLDEALTKYPQDPDLNALKSKF